MAVRATRKYIREGFVPVLTIPSIRVTVPRPDLLRYLNPRLINSHRLNIILWNATARLLKCVELQQALACLRFRYISGTEINKLDRFGNCRFANTVRVIVAEHQ